jgi:3-methyladenine DNA glycosylase AlkC
MATPVDSANDVTSEELVENPESPGLKEIFNAARFRSVAAEIATIDSGFDAGRFLALALPGLEDMTLMQRLRHMTECLHTTLPSDYGKALDILRRLAPRLNHNFASIVLPDYVALYGLDDFELSMEALRFFTPFGSSEFAVREFLRRDLDRSLAVMEGWSRDDDEHVRRLASEGSRPRLPWSFRLDALIAEPSRTVPILENLKMDSSLYVRKSVANHLNDISKDHPAWVVDRLEGWPLENAHTAWIAKRALRTLIKKGDARALSLIGAGEKAQVQLDEFVIQPRHIRLGEHISFSFRLTSTASTPQRLVVDYVVHYVKKAGTTSAKVFKLKEFTLGAGETVVLSRSQQIRDFTTRVHHPGRHEVEIMVNGERLAKDFFELTR